MKNISEVKSANEDINKQSGKLKILVKRIRNPSLHLETNPQFIKRDQGIFNHLSGESKTRPINKGLAVVGNSDGDDRANLLNIIDPDWTSGNWNSSDISNSYVTIEYKQSLVRTAKYRVSVERTEGTCFLPAGILKESQKTIEKSFLMNSTITQSNPEVTISIQSDSIIESMKLIMNGKSDDNDYTISVRNIGLYRSNFLKLKVICILITSLVFVSL